MAPQVELSKAVDDRLIDELVGRAQAEGVQLTGEGGLLQQLTKRLLESALEGEITDHLGYDRHEPAGKNGGNSRNGKRGKTALTDVGPVEVPVPRDQEDTFEPKIVKKRQKRLSGVDETVISLSAKDLTTGEVQTHLMEAYGADVSRQRGRQPAHLRRARSHHREPQGHPGVVGRQRRRGRQTLDAHPHRNQQPRRQRHPHPGLRRTAEPARRSRDGLAPPRADLPGPPPAQLLPLPGPSGLGCTSTPEIDARTHSTTRPGATPSITRSNHHHPARRAPVNTARTPSSQPTPAATAGHAT